MPHCHTAHHSHMLITAAHLPLNRPRGTIDPLLSEQPPAANHRQWILSSV